MATKFTSQEILVVINTKFAAKEFELREEDKNAQNTQAERLANDCWNGLLHNRLPEISITKNNRPLPIQELGEGRKVLYLKMGEADEALDEMFSINPYKLVVTYN